MLQGGLLGPVDKVLCPEAQRDDMDEGEVACRGFVVSGGEAACVFQPVEAALDAVAQGIDEVVDGDLDLAALAHGNDGHAAAALDIGAHAVGVVALVAEKHPGVGRARLHHEVVAFVVRDFPAGDLNRDRQALGVGPEMDFGGEAALRAAETLFLRPPFAPAA